MKTYLDGLYVVILDDLVETRQYDVTGDPILLFEPAPGNGKDPFRAALESSWCWDSGEDEIEK